MKALDNFITQIRNLTEKDFMKYMAIFMAVIFLFLGFILYRNYSKVKSLKTELRKVNNARQEAQVILSKDIQVKKQKQAVDEIIQKEKKFKLIEYLDQVSAKLGISNNIKDKTISISDLENLSAQGYAEVKLTIILTGLNMKQLVELLDEFEKNERIYTKSLEITKAIETPTLDVNIVIATLQPKEEVTEITE